MRWGVPDAKVAVTLGECVSEDDDSLLREPERGLEPAPPVLECDDAAEKHGVEPDWL